MLGGEGNGSAQQLLNCLMHFLLRSLLTMPLPDVCRITKVGFMAETVWSFLLLFFYTLVGSSSNDTGILF